MVTYLHNIYFTDVTLKHVHQSFNCNYIENFDVYSAHDILISLVWQIGRKINLGTIQLIFLK